MNQVVVPGMVDSEEESENPSGVAFGAGNEVSERGWGRGGGERGAAVGEEEEAVGVGAREMGEEEGVERGRGGRERSVGEIEEEEEREEESGEEVVESGGGVRVGEWGGMELECH
ncbi:hypothetical protein ACET3Z_002016 [Daucus carota]